MALVRIIEPLRGPFTFPGGAARLNQAHPAANNLLAVTAPIGGNHRGIAGGIAALGTLTGTPAAQVIGSIGPAVACSGTNRSSFTIPNIIYSPYTVAGIFWWSGTNATSQSIAGNSNATGGGGLSLSLDTSGFASVRVGGALPASSLPVLVANRSYFMAASGISGTGYNIAYTCLETGQIFFQFVSSVATTSANTSYTVGNLGDGSRPLNGSMGPTMYSNILLSLPQLQQWAADPRSFWYPR